MNEFLALGSLVLEAAVAPFCNFALDQSRPKYKGEIHHVLELRLNSYDGSFADEYKRRVRYLEIENLKREGERRREDERRREEEERKEEDRKRIEIMKKQEYDKFETEFDKEFGLDLKAENNDIIYFYDPFFGNKVHNQQLKDEYWDKQLAKLNVESKVTRQTEKLKTNNGLPCRISKENGIKSEKNEREEKMHEDSESQKQKEVKKTGRKKGKEPFVVVDGLKKLPESTTNNVKNNSKSKKKKNRQKKKLFNNQSETEKFKNNNELASKENEMKSEENGKKSKCIKIMNPISKMK